MQRFLVLLIVLIVASCSAPKQEQGIPTITLQGQTMGTTFTVTYIDSLDRIFDTGVDSVLLVVNNSMSTYIPNSIISGFNRFDSTGFFEVDNHFYTVFLQAKSIYRATGGAFNPAVMPLVSYYGFGPDKQPTVIDSAIVDSLLAITDFSQAEIMKVDTRDTTSGSLRSTYLVRKQIPQLQLDFSAIAKGYGVDAVGSYLLSQGVTDWFVEIGGEVATHGSLGGSPWVIGIEDPLTSTVEDRKTLAMIGLTGEAVATSGNYRNVRMIDGVKLVHTINPATGYPAMGRILSASIIAKDCMTADAFATACMVIGTEDVLALLSENGVEGLLVFSTEDGGEEIVQTAGFGKWIFP